MSGSPGALCPLCGLPAVYTVFRIGGSEVPLIGCPCVGSRAILTTTPIVRMTDNHDPGDEDRT